MMSEEQTTVACSATSTSWPGTRPPSRSSGRSWTGPSVDCRCSAPTLLYRGYPRLMQPPVNLQPDELLGAVVERLLKALRAARPQTVREFFALANQHMRWELNDLARRLDNQPAAGELYEGIVPSPPSSVSGLSPDGLRMLQAIDELPEDEREVFDLVRIQGMTQVEAAEVLGVSSKTVQRRLNRALLILSEATGRPPARR